MRCALQSITFNTFTKNAILDPRLLSSLCLLSSAQVLCTDVLCFKPLTAHGGTEVVCMPDDITDKKQQVRRASGFTTIDTNFNLQTSSGGSTAILKADATAFRLYTMNTVGILMGADYHRCDSHPSIRPLSQRSIIRYCASLCPATVLPGIHPWRLLPML